MSLSASMLSQWTVEQIVTQPTPHYITVINDKTCLQPKACSSLVCDYVVQMMLFNINLFYCMILLLKVRLFHHGAKFPLVMTKLLMKEHFYNYKFC